MIVNLTPHAITIMAEETLVIPPTTPSARVRQTYEEASPVNGIPVVRSVMGEVENLPEPVDGTIYVVSAIVAQQCRHRPDVYAPDTGAGAVRDEKGMIVGVKGLVQY